MFEFYACQNGTFARLISILAHKRIYYSLLGFFCRLFSFVFCAYSHVVFALRHGPTVLRLVCDWFECKQLKQAVNSVISWCLHFLAPRLYWILYGPVSKWHSCYTQFVQQSWFTTFRNNNKAIRSQIARLTTIIYGHSTTLIAIFSFPPSFFAQFSPHFQRQ